MSNYSNKVIIVIIIIILIIVIRVIIIIVIVIQFGKKSLLKSGHYYTECTM